MWQKHSRLNRSGSWQQFGRATLFRKILIGILVLTVASVFLTLILFAWYAKDLPRPGKLTQRDLVLSTRIYDRNGILLYDVYGDKNRTYVALTDVPKDLQNATIAIEDKEFFQHQGFSSKGILRAIFNIAIHRSLQGGSTLTQQLVKNALLSQERTLPRKIKEFILAIQVERKYSKKQILELYLNESPYGGTAWGVEAAAENYFGKKVSELNLVESTILAGLPQRPTAHSPFGQNPKAYIDRTHQVLRRMREDGYITSDQEKKSLEELSSVQFVTPSENIKAPHFVMYVKEKLVDQFGEKMVEQGGLQVTTTLDYKLQEEAQKAVKEEVEKAKGLKVGNGAVVVLDPKNGQILAMVGSKDYFDKEYDGNVNVTLSLRQPGSALKPITYATAFEKGYTPATLLFDAKTVFPGGVGQKDYIPENYDGKFRGPIQARFALGNSINLAAVKMTGMIGVREMLSTAYKMGLTNLEPTKENLSRFGLSITLGGGEVRLLDLTTAYGVLATQGNYREPVSILKVSDSQKKALYELKPQSGKKVLSSEVSFLVSHILLDNNARIDVFGPRSWLVISGKTVAVKTGTTDDKRDNWTVGYTPSVVVGVWVGNNDNSVMDPKLASGVTGAAPIWNRVMRFALKDKSNEEFSKPDNIVAVNIDAFGGGLPKDGFPTRSEYFIKGTEPTTISPIYKKLKISRSDGKLANDLQIATGDYEEKDFVVFEEKDPVSGDGKNRWQEGVDAWINDHYKDDSKYHPPKEVSDAKKNDVIVQIKKPGDHEQVDNYDVEISAEAKAARDIVKMILEIDGTEKKTWSGNSFSEIFVLTKDKHKIKVKGWDSAGNIGEAEINIGVLVPWDFSPTPTYTPTPTPTP